MSKLKEKYLKEVVPALKKTGKYKNPMELPRLTKIVVNMGINASVDRDTLKAVAEDLA